MLNDTISKMTKHLRAAIKAVDFLYETEDLIGTKLTAKAVCYAKTSANSTQEILIDCRGRWETGLPMPWESK